MTGLDLSAHFDRFVENVSLGEPQVGRMNSAAASIRDFLIDAYGLQRGAVFIQGSYANGTSVEPIEGGEYDVDIVSISVDTTTTADAALTQLERVFKADGRFAARVKLKNPCVRLEYADDNIGKFHVDVVPVRRSSSADASLDAPRRGDGWHPTAPQEYTAWCRQQGAPFARTVKAMKRWRDEQQTVRSAIKSIVLQVLISKYMPVVGGDAFRLSEAFRLMHLDLSGMSRPPIVSNPVLPSENLADRWSAESFQNFVRELKEAVEWSEAATHASDLVEAVEAWRELLGDDFPEMPPTNLGVRLADYSHAQSPAGMGWIEQHDARYGVSITATQQRGKRGQNQSGYRSNGPLIFAGHKLRFAAEVTAPNHVDVWWQVANTVGHARGQSGLRGDIFRAKRLDGKPSPNQAENWESTSYTGSHLIRAMLVRAGVVVAVSDWFQVNIYAKGRPFQP